MGKGSIFLREHDMYELSVDSHFAAAHCLREYNGDCGRLHGHTWGVSVTVGAFENANLGMAVDFKEISARLDTVLSRFDHQNLNDLSWFSEQNPTAENIARLIFDLLSEPLNTGTVRLLSVTVAESDRYRVTYRPEA